MRRFVMIGLALACLLIAGTALAWQREQQCAYIPLLGEELLPNAGLASANGANMPYDWQAAADGVELRGKAFSSDPKQWGFDLDGDGRTLQLLGIANYLETPLMLVQPQQTYCFSGLALTDSEKQSATRVQISFDWRDSYGQPLRVDQNDWQAVGLWREGATTSSRLLATARAPDRAGQLHIRIAPASDDRVYLDAMHVRRTMVPGAVLTAQAQSASATSAQPVVLPWPNGAKAAVAFTFDWETAMGGMVHTRSDPNDDPHFAESWQARAMRMRDGVTTTLDLFRPFGIRATYYATGYNFLNGNTERRQFMGNPTYAWANPANRWPADWSKRPWFGSDPFGTVQSDPIWYFGDLVPRLQAEQQDIQSHTFAHFAGTFVRKADWQADFAAWHAVAAERGVAPARSLAFPWSASNGMSDDEWDTLAQNGITSVTRLSWSQRKSALFPKDAQGIPLDPRCRPIPGHETILGCPDFYLRDGSAALAQQAIDRAIANGGMIDLWAHTEEVTDASQIATWRSAIAYAAAKRDAGDAWIAPLSEIADWQQRLAAVKVGPLRVQRNESGDNQQQMMTFSVTNTSNYALHGVTLQLSVKSQRATVNGETIMLPNANTCVLDVPAGAQIEVTVWPV